MLAGLRKNLSRLPLAEMSTCSAAAGAVEDHRVVAVLALEDVAAVTGIPDERVVAGTHQSRVAPPLPSIESFPSPPIDFSTPGPPAIRSPPAPPSSVNAIDPAARADGREAVHAAEAVDDELVGRVLMQHCHLGRQAADGDAVCVTADRDVVVAGGAVDGDVVGLVVAGGSAESAGEVEVDACVTPVPVRSLTLTWSAPPRALKVTVSIPAVSMVMLAGLRKNLSRLPLAEMSTCSAACGAVEDHRVVAVLALEDVAAVTGIPDERVVAGTHQSRVGAAIAVDRVIATGADQGLRCRSRRPSCRSLRHRRASSRSSP